MRDSFLAEVSLGTECYAVFWVRALKEKKRERFTLPPPLMWLDRKEEEEEDSFWLSWSKLHIQCSSR